MREKKLKSDIFLRVKSNSVRWSRIDRQTVELLRRQVAAGESDSTESDEGCGVSLREFGAPIR